MCKEWMPRRVEEFWRVQTKAVVLYPPKEFTWIVTVVTVAGGQNNSFLKDFGRTRQNNFSPRFNRLIAFHIFSMDPKSKCMLIGRCYLFRLKSCLFLMNKNWYTTHRIQKGKSLV
jgi:hypothetical protein